jgi:hypothetical protein
MTIRSDLEALLAKAKAAREDAATKMKTALPDDFRDATLKWQALNDVTIDLERVQHHFLRTSTGPALEGV